MQKWTFVFLLFVAMRGLAQAMDAPLADQLQQSKNMINETEAKQRQILSRLFEINQHIQKISKEQSHLENERQLLQISVVDLKEKISDLETTLQEKGRDLMNHIKMIHQSKGFGWLNLMSGSKGPAEADLNLYIFTRMTAQEKEKIQQYFTEKLQLQKNQKKLQARLFRLEQVTQNLLVRQEDFLDQQNNRKSALNEIKIKKSHILEKLKNLRNNQLAQKLDDTGLLDSLIQPSFLEGKGRLDGPTQGILKQRFGIVQTARATYYKNHKGIFIQTQPHQDIQVVFDGKVAFVGEVGGFGNTLIVDHGDHYYTVYSALSSIEVHEGQSLQRNQKLGKTGASQFYSDQGIYFEVRHFSEPQDPMEWIKKGSL